MSNTKNQNVTQQEEDLIYLIDFIKNIKFKLEEAEKKLLNSKKIFIDGGWSLYNTFPIANEEFKKCESCLKSAQTSAKDLIQSLTNFINTNYKNKHGGRSGKF